MFFFFSRSLSQLSHFLLKATSNITTVHMETQSCNFRPDLKARGWKGGGGGGWGGCWEEQRLLEQGAVKEEGVGGLSLLLHVENYVPEVDASDALPCVLARWGGRGGGAGQGARRAAWNLGTREGSKGEMGGLLIDSLTFYIPKVRSFQGFILPLNIPGNSGGLGINRTSW